MSQSTFITHDVFVHPWPVPDASVQLIMFSPPYWSLRTYHTGSDHELGHELDPDAYADRLASAVSSEAKRVLHPTGHLVVNVGDCYMSDSASPRQLAMLPARTALAFQRQGWILRNDIVWAKQVWSPTGNLLSPRALGAFKRFLNRAAESSPSLFAPSYALLNIEQLETPSFGSVKPTSIRSRFTSAHEHIFVFQQPVPPNFPCFFGLRGWVSGEKRALWSSECSRFGSVGLLPSDNPLARDFKSRGLTYRSQYFFDADAIRIKTATPPPPTHLSPYDVPKRNSPSLNPRPDIYGERDAKGPKRFRVLEGLRYATNKVHPLGKIPCDVWQISNVTDAASDTPTTQHYAAYTESVCEPFVKAMTYKTSAVLDPFCGTGTTCLCAIRMGRTAIGFDINPDYVKMAERRCRAVLSGEPSAAS